MEHQNQPSKLAEVEALILQEFMKNIVRQIAFLDIEKMRQVLEESRRSRNYWDTLGSMLDPTRYRNMLHSGALDHASLQCEAVEHLIVIRELVDKMDAIAQRADPHAPREDAVMEETVIINNPRNPGKATMHRMHVNGSAGALGNDDVSFGVEPPSGTGGESQQMTVDTLRQTLASIGVPSATDIFHSLTPNVFFVSFAEPLTEQHKTQMESIGIEVNSTYLQLPNRYMLKWERLSA